MLQDYEIKQIKIRCKELNVDFNDVMGSMMLKTSYKKIMEILSLKEWNNPKFCSLLTPTIWQSNYENIKKILEMEEWNDPKFQPLLTSNIWVSNYKNAKNILGMEEWNDVKYSHLLSPSILPLNPNKIRQSIALAHKFDVDGYITGSFMRKPLKQTYALIMYLQDLNIPLVGDNNKLNSIFSYESSALKKKYNIDLKVLTKLYSMPNDFLDSHLMPKML